MYSLHLVPVALGPDGVCSQTELPLLLLRQVWVVKCSEKPQVGINRLCMSFLQGSALSASGLKARKFCYQWHGNCKVRFLYYFLFRVRESSILSPNKDHLWMTKSHFL